MTLPEANFRYTKNFRLRRQHQQQHQPLNQQQHQQPKQQPKQQPNQQPNQQPKQQPKQQQHLIEFGPPAQIYGARPIPGPWPPSTDCQSQVHRLPGPLASGGPQKG